MFVLIYCACNGKYKYLLSVEYNFNYSRIKYNEDIVLLSVSHNISYNGSENVSLFNFFYELKLLLLIDRF